MSECQFFTPAPSEDELYSRSEYIDAVIATISSFDETVLRDGIIDVCFNETEQSFLTPSWLAPWMDEIVPKIQSTSSTRFVFYFSSAAASFQKVACDCIENGHITTFIISYDPNRDKFTISVLDEQSSAFVRVRKERK